MDLQCLDQLYPMRFSRMGGRGLHTRTYQELVFLSERAKAIAEEVCNIINELYTCCPSQALYLATIFYSVICFLNLGVSIACISETASKIVRVGVKCSGDIFTGKRLLQIFTRSLTFFRKRIHVEGCCRGRVLQIRADEILISKISSDTQNYQKNQTLCFFLHSLIDCQKFVII